MGVVIPDVRLRVTVEHRLARGAIGGSRPPDADGEGGRGLQVIATLSQRWGCDAGPGGKVVWCELPAEPARH